MLYLVLGVLDSLAQRLNLSEQHNEQGEVLVDSLDQGCLISVVES